MKTLLGPTNLSTNHDCGILVEGFERPPTMMMPYNFRYYPELLLANGLTKAKDLFAYDLSTSVAPPEKLVKAAEKAFAQGDLVVRPIDLSDLSNEKRRIQSVYHALLERVWGFVPLSPEELDAFAARVKPLILLRPELVLLALVKDEPVGFALTLIDSNVALKAARGHLTRFGVPIGLARMFWASRSIDRVRVLTAGVKPAWRRKGIDSALYLETLRQARRLGFSGGEAGWVLEDDEALNGTLRQLGQRSKTLRLYERKIGPSVAGARPRRQQSRAD
jgi:GNAT superfamily N-acetyltransferase